MGVLCLSGVLVYSTQIHAQRVDTQRVASEPERRAESASVAVVTLDVTEAPVLDVLRAIARQAGLQVSGDESVLGLRARRITLRARGMLAEEAFAKALAGTGVQARVHGAFVSFVRDVAAAAQGVITGKVIDAKSRQGLRGATITVSGINKGTTSGEDGAFRIADVAAGSYTVQVRMLGYVKAAKTVTVIDGRTASIEVALEPSVNSLDQVVVTGTVAATAMRDVPNAMTVITAKDLYERGITRLDQLFRGEVPGLFVPNAGSDASTDRVVMFSRGATALDNGSLGNSKIVVGSSVPLTTPMKTYVDGIQMADATYLNQIDPRSIDRIEILPGPQASTIYGSDAINGVIQIFTKRGSTSRPQVTLNATSGFIQNNFSSALAPGYSANLRATGIEGRLSYMLGGMWNAPGSWSPAKHTQAWNGNGGIRMEYGLVALDLSALNGVTANKKYGDSRQLYSEGMSDGSFRGNAITNSLQDVTSDNVTRNLGGSLSHRTRAWWSQVATFGVSTSANRDFQNRAAFSAPQDSTGSYLRQLSSNMSQSYTTVLQVPLSSLAQLDLSLGADHRRTTFESQQASPVSLTGSLANPSLYRQRPQSNSGAFGQTRLALPAGISLTYGMRADWNTSFGSSARVTPGRFGVSMVQEIGAMTGKLRAAYGRSTRPPAYGSNDGVRQTQAFLLRVYGDTLLDLIPNEELTAEYQQGGEGGVELYWGNRGSLQVTRYNQTVSDLIAIVRGADSVRSRRLASEETEVMNTALETIGSDGYRYYRQRTNLNIGNIRNQGWELSGMIRTGPLNTTANYSWTKSRVIGITPKYRALLTGTQYEVGRPFDFLAEHTWALRTTYTSARNTVSLGLNGIGQLSRFSGDLAFLEPARRLDVNKRTMKIAGDVNRLRFPQAGYYRANLNAVRVISSQISVTLNVQNLMNTFENDGSPSYAAAGRSTQMGFQLSF